MTSGMGFLPSWSLFHEIPTVQSIHNQKLRLSPLYAPVIRSLEIFKYALVWLLIDYLRAGCDYVFECVKSELFRYERGVPKMWSSLTCLCMCVSWFRHGLKLDIDMLKCYKLCVYGYVKNVMFIWVQSFRI